jgi:hypothetical protein
MGSGSAEAAPLRSFPSEARTDCALPNRISLVPHARRVVIQVRTVVYAEAIVAGWPIAVIRLRLFSRIDQLPTKLIRNALRIFAIMAVSSSGDISLAAIARKTNIALVVASGEMYIDVSFSRYFARRKSSISASGGKNFPTLAQKNPYNRCVHRLVRHRHRECPRDDTPKVGAAPAHHAVLGDVGAFFDEHVEFLELRVAAEPRWESPFESEIGSGGLITAPQCRTPHSRQVRRRNSFHERMDTGQVVGTQTGVLSGLPVSALGTVPAGRGERRPAAVPHLLATEPYQA